MTDLPEELQAELVEFVRIIASGSRNVGFNLQHDAKEILERLPAPVDPDIEEARKLIDQWGLLAIGTTFDRALEAIKRGRELERSSQ